MTLAVGTMLNRRTLLQGATGVAAVAMGMPAIAAGPTPLRVGFLHGLAADAQLWVAEHLGSFKEQGLAIETIQFVTGLEAFQALAGGSLDLVTTGAVISNFPARGQGKAFLINSEEFGLAQIWVHPAAGIRSVADLKGRQVATSRGTTGHYFLYRVHVGTTASTRPRTSRSCTSRWAMPSPPSSPGPCRWWRPGNRSTSRSVDPRRMP